MFETVSLYDVSSKPEGKIVHSYCKRPEKTTWKAYYHNIYKIATWQALKCTIDNKHLANLGQTLPALSIKTCGKEAENTEQVALRTSDH